MGIKTLLVFILIFLFISFVRKNRSKNKDEYKDNDFSEHLKELEKDRVSLDSDGLDAETNEKWFDSNIKNPLNFIWYQNPKIYENTLVGIDELKSNLKEVDFPIRLNTNDLNRDFNEISILDGISDVFRKSKFLIERMNVDYFDWDDSHIGNFSTDIASFTNRMSGLEKEIWDKNVTLSYKVSRTRSYDYLTFIKIVEPKNMFNSKYIKKIGQLRNEMKDWVKNEYPKHSQMSRSKLKKMSMLQLFYNRFGTKAEFIQSALSYSKLRYSNLFSVDRECSICRNDISDFHPHFYFCIVCINLIDFDSFNKLFLRMQKEKKEINVNSNTFCIYKNCSKEAKKGYFCDLHKSLVNRILRDDNRHIFNPDLKSTKLYNHALDLSFSQGKKFNQIILKNYFSQNDLNIPKIFDFISKSDADNEVKGQCHSLILSLLLIDLKYDEAIEYYYKILDLIDINKYAKPDKTVGKSNQKSSILWSLEREIIDLIDYIIIENKYDFHPHTAFTMSSACIISEDWEYTNADTGRIKTEYAEEFAYLFCKKINEDKDYICSNYPVYYRSYSFDEKQKLWYKEIAEYGDDEPYQVRKNISEILRSIESVIPEMPDEYYHNGKLRPIEYHFDTYNYEEARIYKNNDNDSGWYFEYDYDSIIIDKSIIKTAHKEQTENSEAFDFLEKISDLEKLFRLLDIPKEKIHIFRDKIQKQYFDNRSKFFCIDKHYSVGGFYTQKGDDRNEGKSSFNQDSKWVERIIALQEGIEDKIRAKYNIPASKWISEQKLFEKIKSVFKNEKVIKHGRPKWLNRQHLDIYLPERDIGIEYQGDQHFRPIDFFGGEEAYKETVKRDKRKKRLCAKNNCNLIYVLPEDNFDEVVDKVKTLLIKE